MTTAGPAGEIKPPTPEDLSEKVADFDGVAFTIPYLTTDPDGFEVATTNILRRRQEHKGQLFTSEQAEKLRNAVGDEIKFHGGEDVRKARSALLKAKAAHRPKAEQSSLSKVFEQSRQSYIGAMLGKIGIRNVRLSGSTLNVDVKAVSFPVYTEFAGPENSIEVLDLSSLAGAAMAVRTTDNRLVVQHRAVARQRLDAETLSRGNRVYPDVSGASVAGLIDATTYSKGRQPGTPDPINTDFIRASVLKEADEELGAGANDFSKLRIVGLAHDNISVHEEFLVFADANVSAKQLREQSRSAEHNRLLGDADFEEKFVDIESSPQAIETLLCDVICPLPPTHSALMVACGYSMVLQTEGVEAAKAWKARLEQRVVENYERINEQVAAFYERHPEALDKIPERYWDKNVPSRNPNGYSPMYTPQEQGLPSFEDEMVRTGLVPETRRLVEEAYLIDVDGPLTDPEAHKVTEPELLDIIASKLDEGVPVGLNTGRATEWAIERVVALMKPRLRDPASLANLIVIGEMGGTWATFSDKGETLYNKARQLTIPEELKEAVQKMVEDSYSDFVFFDGDRQSMCSVIMNEDGDLAAFDARRPELARQIEALVADSPDVQRLKVGQTTLAIDINVKYAGKDLGAERFEEWLKAKHIKPKRYITFGDSASDIEMAEQLDRDGAEVLFVFVGPNPVTHGRDQGYRIVHAPGYSQATLEVLKSLL